MSGIWYVLCWLWNSFCRCRYGYFHVVNNYYYSWGIYAVGGSENPTINSEGNYYIAPSSENFKEVTKRIKDDGSSGVGGWESWNWRSAGDIFINGAFFTSSGVNSKNANFYAKATSFSARPASMVGAMTNDAGPLMLWWTLTQRISLAAANAPPKKIIVSREFLD